MRSGRCPARRRPPRELQDTVRLSRESASTSRGPCHCCAPRTVSQAAVHAHARSCAQNVGSGAAGADTASAVIRTPRRVATSSEPSHPRPLHPPTCSRVSDAEPDHPNGTRGGRVVRLGSPPPHPAKPQQPRARGRAEVHPKPRTIAEQKDRDFADDCTRQQTISIQSTVTPHRTPQTASNGLDCPSSSPPRTRRRHPRSGGSAPQPPCHQARSDGARQAAPTTPARPRRPATLREAPRCCLTAPVDRATAAPSMEFAVCRAANPTEPSLLLLDRSGSAGRTCKQASCD